ncbi:MAG TPA: thiamine diphosphokinase [Candidatus Limnocylindria bacterium]
MKAVVVADGEPDARDADQLVDADLIVAADGGARWLDAMGIRPHLLVGDLDSVDAHVIERLAADGVAIERHPADKDASDAELALDRALASGADEVAVLGALGGERLDHELANLLLLADPSRRVRDLRVVRGGTVVRALQGGERLSLRGAIGDLVSLLPIGGEAEGVRTAGLRFPLDGESLRLGPSRGLSNVIADQPASVSLERGTLLVVETASEEERS